MADYIVTSGELTTVANAIRAKNGTSSNLSWPDGFVSGISSGSGGGGESDFSIARVTFINNSETLVNIELAVAVEADGEYPASTTTGAESSPGQTETYNVVLYKGASYAFISVGIDYSAVAFATSENITFDGQSFNITGDGTITISDRT